MKIKSIIILAASSLVLASCLKSKGLIGLEKDSGSIVTEIWDVNYYGGLKALVLENTPPTETVTLATLRSYYPRSVKPGGNVHVTLVLDTAAVTAAGLTKLPANSYSLPSLEFDIPSGPTEGSFDIPITLNKNNLNLANTYGIAFHISAVSSGVISELAKEIVVQIGVKNAYDGVYLTRGYTLRAGDNALTGNFSGVEFGLITRGLTTVDFDKLQVWGDGQTGVAIGNLRLVVDPATNNVTISSPGGAMNFPGYPSRYVPATKTFYIGFTWGAGPGQREGYDTMVYVRPR